MNTQKLSNISLKAFRNFLTRIGCEKVNVQKGRGGHEKWIKEGLTRPIVLQTHIDPIPEFIVRNTLQNLGMSKSEYYRIMKSKAD